MDNRELAKTIVEKIGGSENVKLYTHCITRLRFILKDKSKVDEEGLRQIKEIMGIVDRGGQYQLVIGGDVERVFNELPPFLPGVDQEKPVEETEEQTTEEKKSILQTVIALMGEMGFKTYRMSISWARIQAHVKQGQKIHMGDPLATVDLEKVKASGYSTATMVIVTSGQAILSRARENMDIHAREPLMELA